MTPGELDFIRCPHWRAIGIDHCFQCDPIHGIACLDIKAKAPRAKQYVAKRGDLWVVHDGNVYTSCGGFSHWRDAVDHALWNVAMRKFAACEPYSSMANA